MGLLCSPTVPPTIPLPISTLSSLSQHTTETCVLFIDEPFRVAGKWSQPRGLRTDVWQVLVTLQRRMGLYHLQKGEAEWEDENYETPHWS